PPEHWGEMRRHPDREGYVQAAHIEFKQLEKMGTFELLDPAGYLLRFKARICVRGDLQNEPGNDVYAATGAYRTFRILMAL
ncbi:hypothetical protein K402DRAFT_312380, partial [Aulographum hederae CBS 113979]